MELHEYSVSNPYSFIDQPDLFITKEKSIKSFNDGKPSTWHLSCCVAMLTVFVVIATALGGVAFCFSLQQLQDMNNKMEDIHRYQTITNIDITVRE